jgi:predicted nucleic acid-binding protein
MIRLLQMKIYLDACCLNRPYDDQRQARVHLEAECVEVIFEHIRNGHWQWVGSSALMYEISYVTQIERRLQLLRLLSWVKETVHVRDAEDRRANELKAMGFKDLDALHVACAESGNVDVLLTTDDRFMKAGKRNQSLLKVKVDNPLSWLEEQIL